MKCKGSRRPQFILSSNLFNLHRCSDVTEATGTLGMKEEGSQCVESSSFFAIIATFVSCNILSFEASFSTMQKMYIRETLYIKGLIDVSTTWSS